jgi:hypothetical protein
VLKQKVSAAQGKRFRPPATPLTLQEQKAIPIRLQHRLAEGSPKPYKSFDHKKGREKDRLRLAFSFSNDHKKEKRKGRKRQNH